VRLGFIQLRRSHEIEFAVVVLRVGSGRAVGYADAGHVPRYLDRELVHLALDPDQRFTYVIEPVQHALCASFHTEMLVLGPVLDVDHLIATLIRERHRICTIFKLWEVGAADSDAVADQHILRDTPRCKPFHSAVRQAGAVDLVHRLSPGLDDGRTVLLARSQASGPAAVVAGPYTLVDVDREAPSALVLARIRALGASDILLARVVAQLNAEISESLLRGHRTTPRF